VLVTGLCREMWKADAIHVRCPGNLGLLGAVLAPLFSRRLIAKYAGQWNGFPGEEWTVRLQRAILRSAWWKGPVTVYGKQPGEGAHVVSFFSTMFTREQLVRARARAASKRVNSSLTVAFAGRLTQPKNVDILLRAIAALREEGIDIKGLVVGDGPERDSLRALAAQLGVAECVEFAGAVPPECIPDFLERSDVFVLASDSEGWPKSLAEAMAFGLVCIGSDLGLIRTFLAEERGLTVPPRDVVALTNALRQVALHFERYGRMREQASKWAQGYSLEGLKDALRSLMTERWKLSDGRLVAQGEGSQIR
jgi:glycosyltransferase involved in cell wall biosynthesis